MIVKNHLFKGRVQLMNTALDAYALRQKTIAKNIANVNTPHYQPERVKFEEEFAKINGNSSESFRSKQLNDKRDSLVRPSVENAPIPDAETYHSGESHVNIDKEMSELALNQIRSRFATQMLSRYFKGLGTAITGNSSN
jgi:flagellar basal-body rod protein FlgB